MNGILILPEDIISAGGRWEVGGGPGWSASHFSKLVAVCWTPLTGDWWDYSYLITDIHQVTRADQLPPAPLYQLSVSSPVPEDQGEPERR